MDIRSPLNTGTGRNSSIEALRILAMLFIIAWHLNFHGLLFPEASAVPFNDLFLRLDVLGDMSVDIFILISGFFLCEKRDNKRSLVRLLIQVWSYSLFCLVLYLGTGHPINRQWLYLSLFPLTFKSYWFFTAYFILCLFLPYINLFIGSCTRRQLLRCILLMVVLWSVFPTLTFNGGDMFGTPVLQFLLFFLIGAYIRKYPRNLLAKPRNRVALTLVSLLVLFVASALCKQRFSVYHCTFFSRYALPAVGGAVGLFSLAVYRRPFTNRLINLISSCVFGIYLFHDNSLIRMVIWSEWLPVHRLYDSRFLVPAVLASTLCVFVVGVVIERARKLFVETPLFAAAGALRTRLAPSRGKGEPPHAG